MSGFYVLDALQTETVAGGLSNNFSMEFEASFSSRSFRIDDFSRSFNLYGFEDENDQPPEPAPEPLPERPDDIPEDVWEEMLADIMVVWESRDMTEEEMEQVLTDDGIVFVPA